MTLPRTRPLFAAAVAMFAASALLTAQTPAPAPPSGTPQAAPPPPSFSPTPKPTPSAQAIAEGKALFEKVVAWLGGPQKVASVRDVRTRGRLTAKTPEGDTTMEVQSSMIFPDYLIQEVDSPFGRIGMVVTPTTAFLASSQGTQDLPPAAAAELRKQVQRIPLNFARMAGDPKLQMAAAGKETVNGVETAILDLRYESTAVRWYIDPRTSRILRTEHEAVSADGKPVRMVSDYKDYRVVEGLPVAHLLEISTNGDRDQTLIVEEYKFNTGIERKLFEKPPPQAMTPGHPLHAPAEPARPSSPAPIATPNP